MTEMHPDPIGDSGQKTAQYVQLVVMAAEALAVIAGARARQSAERDEAKAADIAGQLAVNHKAAQGLWEPVLADHKRGKLDVAQTLTAWSATQAWRESDPAAKRASSLAEDRLRETRPAAMMRYDELRSQGLDPVAAMRQVVPLLETNPRIGEPGVRAGALAASVVDAQDVGRLPDTQATRVLAAELNAERDGHEPAYSLSGYELTYGVDDRMADGPHRGWDGRDLDEPHEDVASTTTSSTMPDNPWLEAPTRLAAMQPTDLDLAAATTALLVGESALLTEMKAHRTAAAQQERLASVEQLTVRELTATADDRATKLVDEHADALAATGRHLTVVGGAGAHATYERTATQALAASFPSTMTETPLTVVATAAQQPTATVATRATRSETAKPTLVRR